jgi:putative ABC transport system substrate-binding protein
MKYLSFSFLFFYLLAATITLADNRKVILINTMPVPVVVEHSRAIVNTFGQHGYVAGENFDLEILEAEGSKELAATLLRTSVAKQRPQLVITLATLATQAAVETLAGTNIPILFCVVADPVGAGIVQSLDVASGTNVSGVVFTQRRDTKLEMVMRLLAHSPKGPIIRFGVVCTDYPSAIGDIAELEKLAALSGLFEFVVHQIPYEGVPKGIPAMRKNFVNALESLNSKVDFLWQVADPLSEIDWFTKSSIDSRIPLIHGHTAKSVELGALMTVLYDTQGAALEVVKMAEQIFKGVNVGTLMIATPENFNLYLNMNTAEQLGLTVPSHLLLIAGKNIIW